MSTPAPSRQPGALAAAQQQLDELDALIQRMLTLPANPAEGPAPKAAVPAKPVARVPEPPRREAVPIPQPEENGARGLLAEPLPPPFPDPIEVEFRPVPLGSEAAVGEVDEAPAPAAPFQSNGSHEAAHQADERDQEAMTPAPTVVLSYPVGRRGPLIRINQAFDRLTYPLGGAGYWLRSPIGRDILGWTGVALLAGTAAWALLDWLGWTW